MDPPPNYRLCCSKRLAVSFCLFLALFNMMYNIVLITFANICMVKKSKAELTINPDCPAEGRETVSDQLYEFEWNTLFQGQVLAAFFYGYIVSQFFSTFVVYKFGGRSVLIVSTFMAAAFTLILPESTRKFNGSVIILRTLGGFSTGFFMVAAYDIISHWAVPKETQIIFGTAFLGVPTAQTVNFLVSGVTCKELGWPSLYYINGSWLLTSSLVFGLFMYNSPQEHPSVSQKEKEYIMASVQARKKPKYIPWKLIVTSGPVLSLVAAHMFHCWGLLTVLISLPMFMRSVHNFNLQANSLLSSLPYLGVFLMRLSTTFFLEKLRRKMNVSKTFIRKLCFTVGSLMPAICLFIVTILSCKHRYISLGVIIGSVTLAELAMSGGYLPCPLEIAPMFAQAITSLMNIGGSFMAIMTSIFIKTVTPDETQAQWNNVFYVTSIFYLIVLAIYLFLGSSDLQPWATIASSIVEMREAREEESRS